MANTLYRTTKQNSYLFFQKQFPTLYNMKMTDLLTVYLNFYCSLVCPFQAFKKQTQEFFYYLFFGIMNNCYTIDKYLLLIYKV